MNRIWILLSVWLITSIAAADDAVSFKDKTITMLVASPSGGGTDTAGRLIAPLLANRLPGKPTVIVRNIPGAQGITAMNYFVQQVAADGLTVTMASSTIADPLLFRRPQSHYDPTAFITVGGVGRGGTTLVIRKDAKERLYGHGPPVVMGALGGVPRSGMLMTAWGIEFLGWNARWVTGYRGTNELMLALERGEIDMTSTANLFEIQKLLDAGKIEFLIQSGTLQKGQIVPRPDFGGAPIFADVMQGKIKDPIGQQAFDYWASLTSIDKWLALPPKTPDPVVRAYREAYSSAFTDPAFIQLGKKISEDFEPMPYDDVDFLVRKLAAIQPQAIAYIGTMLRKQGIQAK